MWQASLSLPFYSWENWGPETWEYDHNWQSVTETELSKTSPLTSCYPPYQLMMPQIIDEADGEASAFMLWRRWVVVCVHGAVDFSSHSNVHRHIPAFPRSLFWAWQACVCFPPHQHATSTIPLISHSLCIFLGSRACCLTFIHIYLHFPSFKTAYNTYQCKFLVAAWHGGTLLFTLLASPTV